MTLPLSGLEVVDLGTQTPGKYATFLLAEMGAAVVRVERPAAPVSQASDEDRVLNRGKRSIVLDLRHEEGREALWRLARRADVLLESFRPGVAARLGIDWETLSASNDRLVYCSLSGFGQTGPERDRPAYDLNFVGTSGLLSLLFGAGSVPRVPDTYVSDGISGLMATLAIAFALLEREKTGHGRQVDLAMLDSVFSFLAISHGLAPESGAAEGSIPSPFYSIYETADGRHVTLAAVRPSSRRALLAEIGRPDLAELAAAGEDDEELAGVLSAAFATATAAEWIERLRPLEVEIGPVNRHGEAFGDPQLRARGLVEGVDTGAAGTRAIVTTPFRPTWSEGREPAAAPVPGEHSVELLEELGYDRTAIDRMRRIGVI